MVELVSKVLTEQVSMAEAGLAAIVREEVATVAWSECMD